MTYSSDVVIQGIINYADNEIMNKLPTSGKWIVGTAMGLGSGKLIKVLDEVKDNKIVKMLDIVDENGNIDVDSLISAMKEAANKYGKMTVEIPMVGRLSFSSSDIDDLRRYIVGY